MKKKDITLVIYVRMCVLAVYVCWLCVGVLDVYADGRFEVPL